MQWDRYENLVYVSLCSVFLSDFLQHQRVTSTRGSGAMVARDTPNVEVPGSSPGCRSFFASMFNSFASIK
jgi:hypothetical protein